MDEERYPPIPEVIPVRPLRELVALERKIQSAGRFGLSLSIDIPTGSIACCPQCGQERTLCETRPNQLGRTMRYWSECPCLIAARERSEALSNNATAAIRGTRGDEQGNLENAEAYDVAALAVSGARTLATFDPDLLFDRAPYDAARQWLDDILERQVIGSYRTGPPAAIFLRGLRGRGKTHLAIGLMLSARTTGHRVAILNEKKYLWQTRTVPFGPPLEALVAIPGERAWLTVIDDIGKHQPENAQDQARVQNAWYNVLDRRYNAFRWSIFTSEKTLSQLVDGGTIDEAMYTRIYELTRGVELVLAGPDQRLAVHDD